jgi:hypothetical protein
MFDIKMKIERISIFDKYKRRKERMMGHGKVKIPDADRADVLYSPLFSGRVFWNGSDEKSQ